MTDPRGAGPAPAAGITDGSPLPVPAPDPPGVGAFLRRLASHEQLNFLLTNRIPRVALTRFMGWFSRIEQPLVRDASIAVWRLFTDLDLTDARERRFESLHACFTRRLREGARPQDPDPRVLVSPCDGIVGACGDVNGTRVFQAKGYPYSAAELFGDPALAERFRDGCYVTLRLTSAMYHHFHAPLDGRVHRIDYISGDCWNVNPVALKRIERLYCRNERAVVHFTSDSGGHPLVIVPVAAVLVASMRFTFVDVRMHLRYRGPNRIDCDAALAKGAEMGHFEHGSTIIVFAPRGFTLAAEVRTGARLRAGMPLMRLPD